MKRAQDKIRDYVETQAFDEVQNLAADPARALAAYRFTDATSDLLARWLDALADLPPGRGAARALAGARGVGKSHTLAVFGALAGSAELRSSIDDAHVGTSARRLLNRRYMVVRVERGMRPSLLDEIAAALGDTFGGNPAQWGSSPQAMLAVAASRALEATLVLVIDTAFNREARVERDDGPVLSELAAAAQNVNAFVALALDDDIADASGVNSVLAASYSIDYLDPEHLYRIADQYLLRKNPQARAALHDIYVSLRATVPGFNWSEPRFAALYPVHPLVADVAAAVRLYAPTFAFLPFAATAAQRAAGRPALSLILLDEVFDRAEHDLRRSAELQEAFAAYDDLATRVVSQFPVMQRLQAKLVLKSLFIHSLDGRGASARELCAGLLLSDENAATGAVARIEETLGRFSESAPKALGRSEGGGETRHRFQISATAKFDTALEESVERTAQDAAASIGELLRSIPRTRFDDWPLAGEQGETLTTSASFRIAWRGSERPGRLIWQQPDAPPAEALLPEAAPADSFQLDWQIVMRAPAFDGSPPTDAVTDAAKDAAAHAPQADETRGGVEASPLSFVWQPSALTAEELSLLRRLVALRADAQLVSEFGDKARAASLTYSALAERIWTRIYMNDGALVTSGARPRPFTDEARAAHTLSAALAQTFAPLFGLRYTQHPLFAETLGDAEVARLVEGFLGNVDVADAQMQHLAHTFALPLGLAAMRGGTYTLEVGDETLASPYVREVLALADTSDGEVVPLERVRQTLRRAPFGLLHEAQHLILAALVAQRRIELVTATGDRISRRTLSGYLKWDELAGLARSEEIQHSAEDLTAWARLLTGQDKLASIVDADARLTMRAALELWLEEWRALRVLENFAALPDEALTTRAWSVANGVRKSFGAAADTIEAVLSEAVSLEEGLQRLADAFGGQHENFARLSRTLADLSEYVTGFGERERARAYLAFAEPTAHDDIECARRELLTIAEDAHSLFDPARRERFRILWREFRARYTELYTAAHERAVAARREHTALDALMGTERWREFDALSQLSIVNPRFREDAEALLELARGGRCDLPVEQVLEESPVCACAFRLSHDARLSRLPQDLEELMNAGIAAYRRTLSLFSKQLRHSLDAVAAREQEDADIVNRARALANALAVGLIPEHLSRTNVRLIDRAIKTMSSPPPVRVASPTDGCGLLTREELGARLRQWLDDLPDHSALVEIISERETDAA